MATQITTAFTKWDLSEEEEKQGSMYTVAQTQVLQNELAIAAEELLGIKYDPSEPLVFAQQEAYRRGKSDLIVYLLDRSLILQNPESQT